MMTLSRESVLGDEERAWRNYAAYNPGERRLESETLVPMEVRHDYTSRGVSGWVVLVP
jgi:hypothetical protein